MGDGCHQGTIRLILGVDELPVQYHSYRTPIEGICNSEASIVNVLLKWWEPVP